MVEAERLLQAFCKHGPSLGEGLPESKDDSLRLGPGLLRDLLVAGGFQGDSQLLAHPSREQGKDVTVERMGKGRQSA